MELRTSWIITLLISILLLTAFVSAQENGVMLEFKYHSGDVNRYQMNAVGSGTMQMSGMENALPMSDSSTNSFPITLDLHGYMTMSTKQVDTEGTANIDLTFDELVENIEMMGQKIAMLMSKDKIEMYMNGNQMFSSSSSSMLPFFGKPISYKVTKSGKMVEFGGMELMNELMKGLGSGIDFNDIVKQTQPVFPEYPVKVNDSWVSTTELKIPQLSGKTANMVMRSTLQGFETIEQSRCAVIKVSGNFDLSNMKFTMPGKEETKGLTPEINFKKLHQVIKGKIYHALVEGQMVKAEYDQNLGMEMAMTMSIPNTKTKSEITTSMDLVMHLTMELED